MNIIVSLNIVSVFLYLICVLRPHRMCLRITCRSKYSEDGFVCFRTVCSIDMTMLS